jgi:hypothetical protein
MMDDVDGGIRDADIRPDDGLLPILSHPHEGVRGRNRMMFLSGVSFHSAAVTDFPGAYWC